jgi:hypothetical protein
MRHARPRTLLEDIPPVVLVGRHSRDIPPARFVRDPGHERALRAANGVDLFAEQWTELVIAAAAFFMLLVVAGVALTAC